MSMEFLGFVAGAALVGGGVLLFLRHEGWKAIRSAYGRDGARQGGGNALIWPSR